MPGLAELLTTEIEKVLKADTRRSWELVRGGKQPGYGLIARIRPPTPFRRFRPARL